MSINECRDKQIVVYMYNGIFYHKKGQNTGTYYSLGDP